MIEFVFSNVESEMEVYGYDSVSKAIAAWEAFPGFNNVTLPYVLKLVNLGFMKAVKEDELLRKEV